jgi:hypothetical protein
MTNQIANTILAQIGGNKFIVMTGAKNLVAGENFLQFSIGRGAKNKANMVKITLDADDTYTVEYFNYRKFEAKSVACNSGIYADKLQSEFTNATGFDTKL